MWRWIAISLTSLAVLIGLWGAYGWWRSGTPPAGDISLESVTPPNTVLSIHPQRYCDKRVPGFWATGSSAMAPDEVSAWFDGRFGPPHQEATTRLSNTSRRTVVVYDDIRTVVAGDASGSLVWVLTYETISHDCLRDAYEPWDHMNAATFIDACDKIIIEFWGVEYGADITEDPPADAAIVQFAEGRAIAHSEQETDRIHATTGPDSQWRRYIIGNACFAE